LKVNNYDFIFLNIEFVTNICKWDFSNKVMFFKIDDQVDTLKQQIKNLQIKNWNNYEN